MKKLTRGLRKSELSKQHVIKQRQNKQQAIAAAESEGFVFIPDHVLHKYTGAAQVAKLEELHYCLRHLRHPQKRSTYYKNWYIHKFVYRLIELLHDKYCHEEPLREWSGWSAKREVEFWNAVIAWRANPSAADSIIGLLELELDNKAVNDHNKFQCQCGMC